ncbi:hypothetical protein [Sphingomonas sp. LM7]|uniref:hypothetical protein n=1 Tax=Sphingomonas sp. LM7 TaxID=1938607 RepID=UPI000983922A|nr:hypothetical protein [Sphingomonas sp. LM7]AQR75280.1 hypothetical protein BXU08_17850 [Sphingomonas sp. LM7]
MLLTALALTIAVPQCRTYDVRLPAPLAGWTRTAGALDTGGAVTLHAGRDGALSTTVRIRKAGTYGIALSEPGWIDLAPARGKALESVAHGHGPECTTIRKIVRYKLRPGTYRVTVNKLKATRARLMLVRY